MRNGQLRRCRAKSDGCIEKHYKHLCRLCDKNNSDHLSRNCPQASTLYHGTTADAAKNIIMEGLKCSPIGRLGRGIYFVDNRDHALTIARVKNPNNWSVLECRVNLGAPKRSSGNQSPDTITRLHGTVGVQSPWAGITTDFMEYCLTNEKKCNVVAEISKNGEFIIMNKIAILKELYQISQASNVQSRNPVSSTKIKQPATSRRDTAFKHKNPKRVQVWKPVAASKRQLELALRKPDAVPKQTAAAAIQPVVDQNWEHLYDKVPKHPTVVPKQTTAAAIQPVVDRNWEHLYGKVPKHPTVVPKQTAAAAIQPPVDRNWEHLYGKVPKHPTVVPKQTTAAAIQPVVDRNWEHLYGKVPKHPTVVPKQTTAAAIQPVVDRNWEHLYGKVPKHPTVVPKQTAAAAEIQPAAAPRERKPATGPKKPATPRIKKPATVPKHSAKTAAAAIQLLAVRYWVHYGTIPTVVPKQTSAAAIQPVAALRISTPATVPKQTAAGTATEQPAADPYLQQYGKVSEQRIEDRYPKQPTAVVPKQTAAATAEIQAAAAAIQAAAAPTPRIRKPATVPKQTARISLLTLDQVLAAATLPVPEKIKPATVPKQPAAAAIQPPEDRYWEDYGKVPKQPTVVPKQTARKGPISKIYDQIRRLIVCLRRE